MVPGRLERERQLLCPGLRQGAGGNSQERLVSGRMAREWQLLHSLRVPQRASFASSALSNDGAAAPARGPLRHDLQPMPPTSGSNEQMSGTEEQVQRGGQSD